MHIQSTKMELEALVKQSENVKRSFTALALISPQIIDEEDYRALKDTLDLVASNFETAASMIYEFGRLGITSKKFAPTKKEA